MQKCTKNRRIAYTNATQSILVVFYASKSKNYEQAISRKGRGHARMRRVRLASPPSCLAAIKFHSRDAHAPEFCHAIPTKPSPKREAERRKARIVEAVLARHGRPLRIASRIGGNTEGARLSALHRGACHANEGHGSAPGRASRDPRERRRYLRLGSRSQRCTSHTGHSAGWSMPGTARERGYEPHPQEPHSPHRSAVTGRRPRWASVGM